MTRWIMVLGVVVCCTLFASAALGNPVPYEARVNQDTSGAQQEPSTASFNYRLYVGWKDWRTGTPQCWFDYSSTSPPSWPHNVQMGETSYAAHKNPSLTVNEQGTLFYALTGFDSTAPPSDIFVFTSTDSGLHFGPPVLASVGTPNTFEARPWIAARGDTVYLTYHSFRGRDEWPYRNGDIYFTRSTDRGQNFLPAIRVNDNLQDTTGRGAPTLGVASGGLLYVVWSMDSRNAPEVGIYCATSTDGGRTFGPNHKAIPTIWQRDLPWRTGPLAMSAASRDSGYLYITWADQRDTIPRDTSTDVWFLRSTDQGTSFSTPLRINDQTYRGHCFMPAINVRPSEEISVLWYGPYFGAPGDSFFLAHRGSISHGRTFYNSGRVSSRWSYPKLGGPWGNSIGEYISTGNGGVPFSLFWTDSRGTSQDIYFANGNYSGVEGTAVNDAVPKGVRLDPSVPNPVTNHALLTFSLPRSATTSLTLYDISGRRVKTVTQGPRETGYHLIRWDGSNESGHKVPPGIYFYRLNVGSQSLTRSLVVVR